MQTPGLVSNAWRQPDLSVPLSSLSLLVQILRSHPNPQPLNREVLQENLQGSSYLLPALELRGESERGEGV